MVSDEDLMKKVALGNNQALGLLFDRYHKELYNFFVKTTGNREASSDLTQTVFYRILKYKKSFKESQNFRTWMYQIARNARIDEYRRNVRLAIKEDIFDHTNSIEDHSVEQQTEKAESVEQLQLALNHLSHDKRDLITYGILMEMSSEEVADIFKITANNARVRLHRAVMELKDIYKKLACYEKE